jgi:hypothetical protein
LIVLGDTLFQLPALDGIFSSPFVLTSPIEESARWCLAEVDGDNHVRSLVDKVPVNPGDWPALIGVYYLDTADPARERLGEISDTDPRSIQLSDALEPYIREGRLRAHTVAEWLDCGNIDMLTSSRRRLLATRSFNQKNLSITLEYYGYPTLSEMWVFESFEPSHWKAIFKTLREILQCFGAYGTELRDSEVFRFYWEKTEDRVAEFAAQDEIFRHWIEAGQLLVNGRPLRTWSALAERVKEALVSLSQGAPGRIIHGDLCFPNILFDPVSRLFKFIDPRGAFGEAGIFGDGRYDVAKLSHSIHGGYDFLIHEMFTVRFDAKAIELEQFFPPSRAGVLDHFAEIFGPEYDLRAIHLIEALLFISMCPLHADSKPRQAAMYATGLRLLNELFP